MRIKQTIEMQGKTVGTIENGKFNLNGIFTKENLVQLIQINEPELTKIGDRIQGGIYIGQYNGKHVVIAEEDALEELNWQEAMEYCSNIELNGYNDWYLPSKDELNFAYENARQYMNKGWYWSSTEYSSAYTWGQHFSGSRAGLQGTGNVTYAYYVRAFRTF
jgi:hypothetical protein